MRKGKNRVCEICGQVIKPGGMGGHMRLAHGISIKKVVRDIRGDVRDARDVPKSDLNDIHGDARDVRDVSEIKKNNIHGDVREIRPSDYVKKSQEVIDISVDTHLIPCIKCGKLRRPVHDEMFICFECWMKEHPELYKDKRLKNSK